MLSPGNTGALSELTAQWERQEINEWQYNLNVILEDCTKRMGSLRTSTAWEAECENGLAERGGEAAQAGLSMEHGRAAHWGPAAARCAGSGMSSGRRPRKRWKR